MLAPGTPTLRIRAGVIQISTTTSTKLLSARYAERKVASSVGSGKLSENTLR